MESQQPSACGHQGGPSPEDALDQQVRDNLDRIRCKLLVMSGKGGVGKSTVAAYLALGLAAKGNRVGLLDVDLHGPSVPRILGVDDKAEVVESQGVIRPKIIDHGLKVLSVEMLMPDRDGSVIWRGPLKIGVIKQFLGQVEWGDLDYLVIDSPPGTGDEPLTVAQLIDTALAVVVTTPQEVALADVRKSVDFCLKVDLPILGVVENMSGLVCPHCGEPVPVFGQGGGHHLAKRYGLKVLSTIPLDARLVDASDQGRPMDMEKESGGAVPGYTELVDQVVSSTNQS